MSTSPNSTGGIFVQRRRPVSLGSQTNLTLTTNENRAGMTPVRYYRNSTDVLPASPEPDVVIPDHEFLAAWYRENYWKVDAYDVAQNQLVEILSKNLPGYTPADIDLPMEAHISVLGHYIDELQTKLNEFDIDFGQISGGEIAGRIESHRTKVFVVISRYKRMLDAANETIYQLRDHNAHLDSELTGALEINASLRRALATGEYSDAEAVADFQGRMASAVALSSTLQRELERSRRESLRLYQSLSQITDQNLNIHEESMKELAHLSQRVEINTMLEEAIKNNINQLEVSFDQADRAVMEWHNCITRALGERELEINELQQRVQYKNNEVSRLATQHEDLLKLATDLEDRIRRARERILIQETEMAALEEQGGNATFTRPMNFLYNTYVDPNIPCGFGPTESTGELTYNVTPFRGATFSVPAVNQTVVIPQENPAFPLNVTRAVISDDPNTTRIITQSSPLNRTYTAVQNALDGSISPLLASPTNRTVIIEDPTSESPHLVLNATTVVSPSTNVVANESYVVGEQLNYPSSPLGTSGRSIARLSNRFDVGKALNMTTSISGSPKALKQWTTMDCLAPGSGSDRIVDSPVALNTTACISPRRTSPAPKGSYVVERKGSYVVAPKGSYVVTPKGSYTIPPKGSYTVQPSSPTSGRRNKRRPPPLYLTQTELDDSYPSFHESLAGYYTYSPSNLYDLTKGFIREVLPRKKKCLPPPPPIYSYGSYKSSKTSLDLDNCGWYEPERSPNESSYISSEGSGTCNGRYVDISKIVVPDTSMNEVFFLPGHEPGLGLTYPSNLPKFPQVRRTYPQRAYYRPPVYGKYSFDEIEFVDDKNSPIEYPYPDCTESPPGVYTFSPTHPYALATPNSEDSALKRTVVLQSPSRTVPLYLDIDVQPQPIIETESGEHVVCDISLDMKEPDPLDKTITYVRADRKRAPNLNGTPRGIFQSSHFPRRNLTDVFNQLSRSPQDLNDSSQGHLSPDRTLTPQPDMNRTY